MPALCPNRPCKLPCLLRTHDSGTWATNALNTYITKPCHEKIWGTLGREFGDYCGWNAMTSVAAFRAHLNGYSCKMGYCSCPTDPDLWLKEQTDPKGRHYYTIILCYVDHCLWFTIT
ncbi:hypothetical protein ACHAW6_000874 [Cyclotella cf. meneghiniana]